MIKSISQIDFIQMKDICNLETCLLTDIDKLSDQEYNLFSSKTRLYDTNSHMGLRSREVKIDYKYICIYVNDYHLIPFLSSAFSTIDCILRNNNQNVTIFIYIKTMNLN